MLPLECQKLVLPLECQNMVIEVLLLLSHLLSKYLIICVSS